MKKGLKKAKAKVGQLFRPSRPGSRSQTPGPPDLDPGPVQSMPSASDTSPKQDAQPSQLVVSEPAVPVAQASTHLDHDPVPPAPPVESQVPQSVSGASPIESARLVSHGSLGHGVVCMTRVSLFRYSYSL